MEADSENDGIYVYLLCVNKFAGSQKQKCRQAAHLETKRGAKNCVRARSGPPYCTLPVCIPARTRYLHCTSFVNTNFTSIVFVVQKFESDRVCRPANRGLVSRHSPAHPPHVNSRLSTRGRTRAQHMIPIHLLDASNRVLIAFSAR